MLENENKLTVSGKEFLNDMLIPIKLAVVKKTGYPVVLSLWYMYKDNKLYCATRKGARVVKYIRQNNKCAFEIASERPPYKGLRGEGRLYVDKEKGPFILRQLIQKYLKDKESKLKSFLMKNIAKEVAIEIDVEKWYGFDYSSRMDDEPLKDPQSS